MNNPFINTSITLTHIDERDNDNIELDQSNIINYYNTLYIVCKKKNYILPSEIYNSTIDEDIFLSIGLNLILFCFIYIKNYLLLKKKYPFKTLLPVNKNNLNNNFEGMKQFKM